MAFERILNVPKRSIGDTTVKAINNFAKLNKCSLEVASKHLIEQNKIKPKTKLGLNSLLNLLAKWRSDLKNKVNHNKLLQTILDASPEPMATPVANRTGEIMGKGIQQMGAVMRRVQKRQELSRNINLSRQFNADLITFQGDFEANEDLSDSNSLLKYDEQINSKINDIINNYQGSDDSKQKLVMDLQGQASTYRAKIQVKIRNKQLQNVYEHINDGLSPILQNITEGNLDVETGLQQAFNNINTYGKELGTNQRLDLYDAFQEKVGISHFTKLLNGNDPEGALDFLSKNRKIANAMSDSTRNKLIQRAQSFKQQAVADFNKKSFEQQQRMQSMPDNKELSAGEKLYVMTGNSSLLAEEYKIKLKRKEEEFKVKQQIEKDKPLITQKIKDLNTETNRLLTNIDEAIIQMSDLGESGVDDYRSADENGKAKILNEAKRLIEDQDYAFRSVGMAGAFLSMISGTDASQLESKMEDIKSNVALIIKVDRNLSSRTRLNTLELNLTVSSMGSLEISDPMTMYKSLNDIRETIARINQQQQEIYKNTYGELPIEKPTSNSRPAIYDNNGNKMKIYNVDNDGNVTVE